MRGSPALTAALFVAALLANPDGVRAQLRPDSVPAIGVGVLIGTHGLGLELEFRPMRRAAILARAESSDSRITNTYAIGLRADLHQVEQLGFYGTLLAGGVRCDGKPNNEVATTCTQEDHFRKTIAGLVGMEFAFSRYSPVAAGIEGGYWHVFDEGSGSRLSHMSFNVVVRVRA